MRYTSDRWLRVLANDHQRRILFELVDQESRSNPIDELTTERATRIDYWHHYLPKLDHYELIDWDPETHRIERGPNFTEIEPMLEAVADRDWDRHR